MGKLESSSTNRHMSRINFRIKQTQIIQRYSYTKNFSGSINQRYLMQMCIVKGGFVQISFGSNECADGSWRQTV